MKLQVLSDNGEVAREIQTEPNFMILYSDREGPCYDTENLRYMRFGDRLVLKRDYVDIAKKLAEKYSTYLYHISPDKIACVVDELWEPTERSNKNSKWKIDIRRASSDFRVLSGIEYIIKARQHWIEKWSEAQLHAAIFGQLLRVNPEDGSILKYTEDFHSKMISTFGAGYLDPQTVIPDMLKEEVKIVGFKQANGQISIDEIESESDKEAEAS